MSEKALFLEEPSLTVPGWVIVYAMKWGIMRNNYIVQKLINLVKEQWQYMHAGDQWNILLDLASERDIHNWDGQREGIQLIDCPLQKELFEWCIERAPEGWRNPYGN